MTLQPEDVDEILAILDSTAYDELVLRTTRFAITLRRRDGGWTQQQELLTEPTVADPAPPGQASHAVAAPSDPGPDESGSGLLAVRAPLVGTFYRSPRPGADPFVQVGDRVEPDTVVGILETMKLMTSIPAGVAGRIVQILVANAEFAESGTVLMRVEAP